MQVFKSERARRDVLASYDELVGMWGVDAEFHEVPTQYGLTHCLTAGSKDHPPLVLLHGVGDNSAVMWALNMRALSERYYCIAIDTLGGPGKSVPNERYAKGQFQQTEWLSEVIDFFKLDKVYLAGVSNGAYMAYHYTTVHPERIRGTMCLEGGIVTSPIKAMITTLLLMFPEILLPTKRNMHRIVRRLSSPQSDVFDRYPMLASHLVLLMKSHNQKAMFPHHIKTYDEAKGAAVKDKLFFLLGDQHRIVTKSTVALIKQGQYAYRILENTGHGINHEQPQAVHDEIFRFFA
ncbi:alpha/beta hydrolase [Paenibacillus paeoniae]|uniref:Alpha/beta hydrolase n=1 Tax=Paenibacillus paeoniae TaxID=2292705 RepID=A0A371PNJ9_9BACL|nr:alpha/beta hydrolase [Paenibacillus paeoniae]